MESVAQNVGPLRIAFAMRVDVFDKPGGDLVQMQKYIALGKQIAESGGGFHGDIVHELGADLSDYDVIHLTNTERPVELCHFFHAARKAGKPMVVSTIHHSYREIAVYERLGRAGLMGRLGGWLGFQTIESVRSLVRSVKYRQLLRPTLRLLLRGMRSGQAGVLHGVDRVLVLADKERRDIQTDFGPIREEQFTLLRNGFEPDVRSARDAVQRDIAVCVIGRIEARKNQIAILEALEALGVPGVFAGGENPNHAGYCARFRAAIAQSKSEFVEGLSHEQVLALMRRSRVHVSASWFEVSSLVDMEAYFAGCCVVSSLRGGTREILKDSAVYVDPADAKGIREAIAFALEQSGVGVAADEVDRGKDLSALSWGAIGLQLLGIYRAVLQRVQNVELPPGN